MRLQDRERTNEIVTPTIIEGHCGKVPRISPALAGCAKDSSTALL